MTEPFPPLSRQGYTSTIYRLPDDPPRVCKAFNKESAEILYQVEKAAYERFTASNHPASILKYYGIHESIPAGLVLELADNKDVFSYLDHQKRLGNSAPDDGMLYRWTRQTAEALAFAHSVGVYNSDIHCVNLVLDQDLNLKVADWAGASIDGSRSHSSYRLRHRLFNAAGTDVARAQGITPETEIFALGTAIYNMVSGQDLWPELREPADRKQIKNRIIAGDFPDTSQLRVLGNVVEKCWRVDFASMQEVVHAVEAEASLHESGDRVTQSSLKVSLSDQA